MSKYENYMYSEENDGEEEDFTLSKIANSPLIRPLSFFVKLKQRFIVNY